MRGEKPSAVCPFVPGERWNDRHQRRMETALDMEDVVRRDLGERDDQLRLVIPTDGHWQVRDLDRARGSGRRIVAQWWPQSGRFVAGENYSRARKCHDVHQMIAALGRVLAEEP
jgi:hypothetical protein